MKTKSTHLCVLTAHIFDIGHGIYSNDRNVQTPKLAIHIVLVLVLEPKPFVITANSLRPTKHCSRRNHCPSALLCELFQPQFLPDLWRLSSRSVLRLLFAMAHRIAVFFPLSDSKVRLARRWAAHLRWTFLQIRVSRPIHYASNHGGIQWTGSLDGRLCCTHVFEWSCPAFLARSVKWAK